MKIFRGLDHAGTIPFPVVTTGSFDGVHAGHTAIINRINKLAHDGRGESVLITFTPHPRKVLYPETAGKDLFLISTRREKIELLEQAGLDNLVEIEFTHDFAKTSSIDFIRHVLVNKIHAHKIVIGFNHHFGHNREGDFEFLKELGRYYGFSTEEIPEQDIQNETVSSTLIRKALQEGRIQRANAYLDYHYMMIGKITQGTEYSKNIEIPPMNILIEEECKLIPPNGVYAARLSNNRNSIKVILMISGNRYDDLRDMRKVQLEIFSIEPSKAFIGKDAKVSFVKQIRNEMVFNSPDELKEQFLVDRQAVEELIF